MSRKKLHWRKAATAALTAAVVLQSGFSMTAGHILAQEEAEVTELQELTAPELQTEEGSASYARLRIGDWLDYGDYGIERGDIPGTDYLFYITTQAADETVINDDQLAYCVQSYFLTSLPGDHSDDMTDQVSAIGDEKNLQKVIYYGYGGAGYEADEFVKYLAEADAGYFETVYANLSESEQAELCYILTHAAASYAYFTDGISLEEYMGLQFRIKYDENWEEELSRFEAQELEKAQIADGDLNLYGATYGMNPVGIALTQGWYQLLTSKDAPGLSVAVDGGTYTFYGNERNPELELKFTVPEEFSCTVARNGQETETLAAGTEAVVRPGESFAFAFSGEIVSSEKDGISDLTESVEGTLSGTENEAWNLVLLQMYKGTSVTVSKRQQDIAAVSMLDAGRTELDFAIEMQKGCISISLTDDAGQAVQGSEFGVYYDAACSDPVQQDGEAVRMTTDSQGEAYLEFVMNQKLEENDSKLYVKQLAVPTGYFMNEEVQCIEVNESAALSTVKETTFVSGTVSWNVPEGTKLPDEISIALRQDDEVVDTKTVSEEDVWSYRWDDLPKYRRSEDGSTEEYDYRVEITPIEGYDTVIDGYDAVNTIAGEISVEGQGIWRDHDDADGLRPESITVNLYCDGELIDTEKISDTDDWRYSFEGLDQYSEDGSKEYTYTVDAEVPEEYTLEIEGDQLVVTHIASTALNIEGLVDLTGRNLEEGEFSFELTQVTDETGKTEVENGIHETAVNDSDGKVVFPDIIFTEPGTYYYRITETPMQSDDIEVSVQKGDEETPAQIDDEEAQAPKNGEETPAQTDDEEMLVQKDDDETLLRKSDDETSTQTDDEDTSAQPNDGEAAYIAKVEVTVGGEDMDQLEAVVTYPNGQPEFEYVHTVSEGATTDESVETEQEDIDTEVETGKEAGKEAGMVDQIDTANQEVEMEDQTDTANQEVEMEDQTDTANQEARTQTEAVNTENAKAGNSTAVWFIILLIIVVFIIIFLSRRRRK